MGFFGDLAMGLGLKDRDASYYDRTAKTIGRNDGAAAEARYRQGRAYTEQPTRGGPVAMIGSAIDRRREGQSQGGWGYGEGDARVSALRDMLDGGGRGRAGQQFEGGLLADLANALGLRPLGYEERLAAAQQQPSQKRAAKASGPDWARAQMGMALEGQAPRFGTAALSFGDGGAMPNDMGFVGAYPLAFPKQKQYSGRGNYGMPTASPLSLGSPSFPSRGGIYGIGMDYPVSQMPASTLPAVTPTGGMPWVHNPLTPSYSNIRGTGTGGGGYGFPVVGTYTF